MKELKLIKLFPMFLILCFAVFTCLTFVFQGSQDVAVTANVVLDDFTVWYVGNSSNLAPTLEEFRLIGAQTIGFDDLVCGHSLSVDGFSVILFESSWLLENKDNPDFYFSLENLTKKGVKLVSIGNLASTLFEALENAEISGFEKDEHGNSRRPIGTESTMVGFKLKQAVAPTGEQYEYPSVFIANEEKLPLNFEGLASWIVDSN